MTVQRLDQGLVCRHIAIGCARQCLTQAAAALFGEISVFADAVGGEQPFELPGIELSVSALECLILHDLLSQHGVGDGQLHADRLIVDHRRLDEVVEDGPVDPQLAGIFRRHRLAGLP